MADGHPNGTPAGWKRCTLGDLCQEDRRLVDPLSDLARELPYISLEHIEANTGRILRDPDSDTSGEGRSTTFAFDERHVLYGKLRPYLNKVAVPAFSGRCTTELIPLLPAEGIRREFLAWLLRRPATVEAAMRHKTGARMPRANMRHLFGLPVEIPEDPDEQARIASRLSQRMTWVVRAKEACRRQEELVERVGQKLLSEFPYSDQGLPLPILIEDAK